VRVREGATTHQPTTPRRPERLLAKGALVLLVAIFPVQYLWTERASEPYPGLMLPSFAPTIQPDFVPVRMSLIGVEFTDGSGAWVGEAKLLGARLGARRGWLMNNVFSRGLDEDGRADPTLAGRGRLRRTVHGPALGYPAFSGIPRAHHPETKAWLRERLAELYPDRRPKALTVGWATVVLELDGTEREGAGGPDKTVRIEL
jgi:hypothetical protein